MKAGLATFWLQVLECGQVGSLATMGVSLQGPLPLLPAHGLAAGGVDTALWW